MDTDGNTTIEGAKSVLARLRENNVVTVWYVAKTPWHRKNTVTEFVHVADGLVDFHCLMSTDNDQEIAPPPSQRWDKTGTMFESVLFARDGFVRVPGKSVPGHVHYEYERVRQMRLDEAHPPYAIGADGIPF